MFEEESESSFEDQDFDQEIMNAYSKNMFEESSIERVQEDLIHQSVSENISRTANQPNLQKQIEPQKTYKQNQQFETKQEKPQISHSHPSCPVYSFKELKKMQEESQKNSKPKWNRHFGYDKKSNKAKNISCAFGNHENIKKTLKNKSGEFSGISIIERNQLWQEKKVKDLFKKSREKWTRQKAMLELKPRIIRY